MRVFGKAAVDRFTQAYASRETIVIFGSEFQVSGINWGQHPPGKEQADVTFVQVNIPMPGVYRES